MRYGGIVAVRSNGPLAESERTAYTKKLDHAGPFALICDWGELPTLYKALHTRNTCLS